MGVFKEEVMFLETLERMQTQVWCDSYDLGIDCSKINMQRMREVVKTLLELPGSKVVWSSNKPAIQREYKLIVMWGFSHRKNNRNHYDAEKCNLTYFKGVDKEFFSIKISHVFTDENGNEI